MVALKILLPNNRYQTYHEQLENLFNELDSRLSTIHIKKIRGIMGIPNNWRRLKTL